MQPMQLASSTRLAGLDNLRALAIVAVMLYHFKIQGIVPPLLAGCANVGWIGVDLFFVLSGFLIGAQLLKPFAAGESPSLADFYLRRAMRILPAFSVVLVLYVFVPAWPDGSGLYTPWQYATFTWNLLMLHFPEKRAFSHIWSLCVEEHFYLLLPALLLLLRPPLKQRTAVLVFVGLLCAGVALRSWLLWHVVLAPLPDDENAPHLLTMRFIYYPTYTRLDGLIVGVALASVRVFRPRWWSRLAEHGHATAMAGCTLVLAALRACDWNYTEYDRPASIVIAFPLLALGFGFLLLSAVSHRGWLRRPVPGSSALAVLAFSLYLVHKAVSHMVRERLPSWATEHGWAVLLLCSIASAAVAMMLYFAVERPFLQLRARWLDHRRLSTNVQAKLDPAL